MAVARLGGLLSARNPDDTGGKLIWNASLYSKWQMYLQKPLTPAQRAWALKEAEKVAMNIQIGLEKMCSRRY